MKKYTKGDLQIHWDKDVCAHSGICVKSLSSVFDPKARPWINVDGATKAEIMATIDKCPSGALSYALDGNKEDSNEAASVSVTIINNGPARIKGKVTLIDKNGGAETKDGIFAICRCGKSDMKPFCDGTHKNLTPQLDE